MSDCRYEILMDDLKSWGYVCGVISSFKKEELLRFKKWIEFLLQEAK